MKNTLKNGLLVLTIIATLVSCSKNNSPKPTSKLSYQFKVTTATAPISATVHTGTMSNMSLVSTPANITWQSGYATVSSISFDGQNENEGDKNEEDNFTEPSPFKVDLFSSNTLLGNIEIANGTYQNVNVKLELKQTATDSALYLTGSYTSSLGTTTPVTLSLDGKGEDFEIHVKAKNISIAGNQNVIEFLDLHLDTLLTGITTADLDAATLTNGALVINSTSNITIYNKILANINDFCDGEDN